MPLHEYVCKHGHITEAFMHVSTAAVVKEVPCSSKGCDEMAQLREYSLPAKRNPRYGIQ